VRRKELLALLVEYRRGLEVIQRQEAAQIGAIQALEKVLAKRLTEVAAERAETPQLG
jgi:hypothetical protein